MQIIYGFFKKKWKLGYIATKTHENGWYNISRTKNLKNWDVRDSSTLQYDQRPLHQQNYLVKHLTKLCSGSIYKKDLYINKNNFL